MGLLNQVIRSIKESLKNIRQKFSRGRKKKKVWRKNQRTVVPEKWLRESVAPKKGEIILKHKKRIPGLLLFKRILAATLLFINFVFSQFLLGSIGQAGQPMFILFLLNCFILADYLWKTRRKPEQ